MEFSKDTYQKAYLQAFDGISEVIRLLEAERVITQINLEAVASLKAIQRRCENIFMCDNQ